MSIEVFQENLRKKTLAKLKELSARDIQKLSAGIQKRFNESVLSEFKSGDTLGLFRPLRSEVRLAQIEQEACTQGLRLCYPGKMVLETGAMEFFPVEDPLSNLSWKVGEFGIEVPESESREEPVLASEMRGILVPGVAFDRQGARIGRGAGFYDRYLSRIREESSEILTCALVFGLQIVEKIEENPWDQRVGSIVTESELIQIV